MKNKTKNITFLAILAFVGCYFARLFHMPNELTVILGGVLCLALLIQQKKIRVDLGLCLLAITLVSYYVIANGFKGIFYAILYIPLVVYVIGKYIICECKDSKEYNYRLWILLMTMIIGYTILGVLNSYMYFAGYVVPGTRRWQDFWSHEVVPGTQHTAYFLPALAMFFPAVMYFKKRKLLNSLFIFLTAFFCYTALVTKSRMQLVVFVIVCFVQLLLFCVFEKEKVKKLLSSKIIWGAVASVIVLLTIGFFMVKDTEIVAAFIDNLGDDGGILKNARFAGQRLALSQLFVYPFGGRQMNFGALKNYCHNTWLDMANASGVIPFFAFAVYTVYSAIILVKLLCRKSVPGEIKIVTAGLYVSFFLYMTVESVFDASIHLLTPWIWVNALICGYLTLKER